MHEGRDPNSASRGVRVLVVDDDPVARLLLTTILADAGFETIEAQNGDQALRTLAAEEVDAVLLDRTMPDMSGVEVLHWIRRTPSLATTPVLMVTGHDEVGQLVEGLGLGANDYIIKPFEPDVLVARLRRHLRGRSEWISIVDREIERRTVLVDAARSASTTTTPEQGLLELCDGLVRIPEVRGAAFVELAGEDAITISVKGEDPMSRLRQEHGSRSVGTHLASRARSGAWLAPIRDDSESSVVAAAPVHADGVLVGVVLAVPETGTTRAGIDRILATVIDFAALAGGVFGTALLHTARRDAAHRTFVRIADAREFNIVYQPIVDLADDSVVGYEALARFDSGTSPLQVFSEATLAGAGHRLELTTLREAIDSSRSLPAGAWLSVNLSPSVVAEEDLLSCLVDVGDRQIVVELSELEPVGDYTVLRERIAALGRNVMLSVDDAGSGFASLAHILALSAHYVKLDQSWIRHVDRDPAKRALVAGIQNFATETGAIVIAEGIETEAELGTVRRLGIPLGQGFLLGRPAVP